MCVQNLCIHCSLNQAYTSNMHANCSHNLVTKSHPDVYQSENHIPIQHLHTQMQAKSALNEHHNVTYMSTNPNYTMLCSMEVQLSKLLCVEKFAGCCRKFRVQNLKFLISPVHPKHVKTPEKSLGLRDSESE